MQDSAGMPLLIIKLPFPLHNDIQIKFNQLCQNIISIFNIFSSFFAASIHWIYRDWKSCAWIGCAKQFEACDIGTWREITFHSV